MAHFAKIDTNFIVQSVFVIDQETVDTGEFGDPSKFIQTSYNTRGGIYYVPNTNTPDEDQSKAFRKNYAGVGYTFNPNVSPDGAFIPPQPYPSWTLNTFSYLWEPPVPYPIDGKDYVWDEYTTSWVPYNSILE